MAVTTCSLAAYDEGSEGEPGPGPGPGPGPDPTPGPSNTGGGPGFTPTDPNLLLGLTPPRFYQVSLGGGPGGVTVVVQCNSNNLCQVGLAGAVTGSYAAACSAAKKRKKLNLRLKTVTTTVPAGFEKKRVTIKIPARKMKQVRKALKRGGEKVRLEVTPTIDGVPGKKRKVPFRLKKKSAEARQSCTTA